MPVPAFFVTAAQKVKAYFYDSRYDAAALILLRIGTGLILLLQLLQLLPDLHSLLGASGLIRPDISGVEVPHYVLTATRLSGWIGQYASVSQAAAMEMLAITYIIAIAFMILGLFTRVSTLVCLILHVAFVYSGHFFSYGVDYFLNILLFYVLIFPVNAEYALDKYIFRRQRLVNYTPYIRLLQLHLCIIYFIGGIAKAFGVNWWNGVSIWKALNRPSITGYDVHMLADYAWLYTAIGIITILIEMLYFLFINISKTRKLWLVLTCLLHLSIAIILHLPFFAAVMILFNMVAFYLPQNKTFSRI
jgi:hypothetical protein